VHAGIQGNVRQKPRIPAICVKISFRFCEWSGRYSSSAQPPSPWNLNPELMRFPVGESAMHQKVPIWFPPVPVATGSVAVFSTAWSCQGNCRSTKWKLADHRPESRAWGILTAFRSLSRGWTGAVARISCCPQPARRTISQPFGTAVATL